jgi:hypothetical protein
MEQRWESRSSYMFSIIRPPAFFEIDVVIVGGDTRRYHAWSVWRMNAGI